MPRIGIVLPAYNEELSIEATLRAFHSVLPDAEVYVIDNASTDNTARVASQAFRSIGLVGSIISEPRPGKGNALRRAFMDVDVDIYVIADADATYPAERASELIAPILEKRADMVVGDRLSGGNYERQNRRRFHGIGNRFVGFLVNRLFGAKLADVMSGYRALSRKFVKNYPVIVEGFEIETDMTLHALHNRFAIAEVPIEYMRRPPGSTSKLRTFSDGAKVLFAIFQILRYYRPLIFFGASAMLLAVAGLVAAIPVFQDWVTERYIYHVPLAILASALEIVAVMAGSAGLILDSIAHQHRADFQRRLLAQS